MASRPVPADGSSTVSAAVSAAAQAATCAIGSGVDSCCRAWLSAERLVWVGNSTASPLQHGQPRAGLGVAQGRGEGAQEEDLRDLAGVIGVLPQPMAFGIAAAEGGDHGLAQHGGRDRGPGLEGGQEGAGGGDERARPQGGARGCGRGRVSGRRRIDEGHGDGSEGERG